MSHLVEDGDLYDDNNNLYDREQKHFNTRTILRLSLSCVWGFCFVVVFTTMILSCVSYSLTNHNSPILLSSYPETMVPDEQYEKFMQPCVFPRLNATYSTTDVSCGGNGFCSEGWTCNSTTSPPIYLYCQNSEFECPHTQLCLNYMFVLPAGGMNETVPTRKSTVVFAQNHFVGGLLLILFTIFQVAACWLYNELYLYIIGDPFNRDTPTRSGIGETLASFYFEKIAARLPNSTKYTLFVNTLLCFSLLLGMFMSIIVMSTGIYPDINDIEYFGGCVNPTSYFIGIASVMAWTIILACIYLVAVIVLWLLLNMYTLRSFYRFWNAHVFIVSVALAFCMLGLGIVVESIDASSV